MFQFGAVSGKLERGSWGLPGKNEPCPALNEGEAREHNPVHEPWCQLCRIRGAKGLIGGEDREQDGDDRPNNVSTLL